MDGSSNYVNKTSLASNRLLNHAKSPGFLRNTNIIFKSFRSHWQIPAGCWWWISKHKTLTTLTIITRKRVASQAHNEGLYLFQKRRFSLHSYLVEIFFSRLLLSVVDLVSYLQCRLFLHREYPQGG